MVKDEIPAIFLPENKLMRIRQNVIYCDACRNYNTLRCPCGSFNRTDPITRKNFFVFERCSAFKYDGAFGVQPELF